MRGPSKTSIFATIISGIVTATIAFGTPGWSGFALAINFVIGALVLVLICAGVYRNLPGPAYNIYQDLPYTLPCSAVTIGVLFAVGHENFAIFSIFVHVVLLIEILWVVSRK